MTGQGTLRRRTIRFWLGAALTVGLLAGPTMIRARQAQTPQTPARGPDKSTPQAPAPQTTGQSRSPAPTAAPTPFTPEEEAARQAVLASPAWHDMETALNRWLDRQQIFNATNVAEIRQRWTLRRSRLSAAELTQLIDESNKKLAVLRSPEGLAAQNWVAQFLAVQAIYPEIEVRRRFLAWLRLTPEEMEAELTQFQAKRANERGQQQVFDQFRTAENKALADARAAAERAAARSRPVGGGGGGGGGGVNLFQPFQPRPYRPPSGPQMFIGPWGGVNMYLGGHRY